jgi:hypothetical protein
MHEVTGWVSRVRVGGGGRENRGIIGGFPVISHPSHCCQAREYSPIYAHSIIIFINQKYYFFMQFFTAVRYLHSVHVNYIC